MPNKRYHIAFGLREEIPLCCIIRWIFYRGGEGQARDRGVCYNRKGVFVPCNVFHKAHEDFHGHVLRVKERREALVRTVRGHQHL